MSSKLVIRNGFVVSMDPAVGEIAHVSCRRQRRVSPR